MHSRVNTYFPDLSSFNSWIQSLSSYIYLVVFSLFQVSKTLLLIESNTQLTTELGRSGASILHTIIHIVFVIHLKISPIHCALKSSRQGGPVTIGSAMPSTLIAPYNGNTDA